MGSLIILGIKPELIDEIEWKRTFDDAMQISKRGELSCRQEKTRYGVNYVSNCLSEPVYDKKIRANSWIASGDLVMGATVYDFTLVDDINFYRWASERARTNSFWDCDILEKDQDGYLILWYGETMQKRAHIWLLAIACLIYSRFPDAVKVNGAFSPVECVRATGLAGDIVGELVEIPKQYIQCDVVKAASELIGNNGDAKYDCNVVTDLYYWDQAGDSVDPKLDSALKHYMGQIDDFGNKHLKKLKGMDEKERLSFLGKMMRREKTIPEKECVVPDKLWDGLFDNIKSDEYLRPYIGLYSIDTEEVASAQLVNLLVTNFELFQYYWKLHLENKATIKLSVD